MPLQSELTLGCPVVWLGLTRDLDHVMAWPTDSGLRVDEHCLLFRADEWTLSAALFGSLSRAYPRRAVSLAVPARRRNFNDRPELVCVDSLGSRGTFPLPMPVTVVVGCASQGRQAVAPGRLVRRTQRTVRITLMTRPTGSEPRRSFGSFASSDARQQLGGQPLPHQDALGLDHVSQPL